MKKAASPEQLNEYIRVTNPGVWLTLAAVIVLLIGACVWGVVGTLETTVDAVAVPDGSSVVCYVKDSGAQSVEAGDSFTVGKTEYTVKSVSGTAQKVSKCPLLTERANYLGSFEPDDWVYELTVEENAPIQEPCAVKIVTESVSPLSFVFN